MVNRKSKIVLFVILSFIMGAVAGALVWVFFRIMNGGTALLWEILPRTCGIAERAPIRDCGWTIHEWAALVYDISVCTIGGITIGLWQKRHGVYPETLDTVMEKVKTEGGYPYDKIHILLIAALLPIIFGGAIGPEAGLTGVIAGLCTMIGDRLKYKGDEVKKIAEAGLAATLGVIFASPLFGIVGNVEKKDWASGRAYAPEKSREPLLSKSGRIIIYMFAVTGAMLSFKGLSALFGGIAGLPRFSGQRPYGINEMLFQWKWAPLLIFAGILAALLFILLNKLTTIIGNALLEHRVISCTIAGIILGVVGSFCSSGRFSGEAQMKFLIENHENISAALLLIMGLVKLLMVNISVNMGWKGGTIFPIIYSAVAIGYASPWLIEAIGSGGVIEGTFAVAVIAASMLGFMMRKPVTVIAILLLCFPLTYLPALTIASFISAFLGKLAGKFAGKLHNRQKK